MTAMKKQTFEQLVAEVRACQACKEHLPLPAKAVFQAHPRARVLIASQAPGRRAHASGLPFDDLSGDRLRAWLAIDRATFYDERKFAIVPMGFCYPGTGKSGDLAPRSECALLWRKTMLQSLPDIDLTLVIGQYALAWHLGAGRKESLAATVADWERYWPKLLPMPHPSPRNLGWLKAHPWFEKDIIPMLRTRIQELISSD
jgi:uracil-DNA glycosylase